MSDPLRQSIMAELKGIINPKTNNDIVSDKNIKSLNNVIISENRIKNKQKHIVLKSIVLINFNISF